VAALLESGSGDSKLTIAKLEPLAGRTSKVSKPLAVCANRSAFGSLIGMKSGSARRRSLRFTATSVASSVGSHCENLMALIARRDANWICSENGCASTPSLLLAASRTPSDPLAHVSKVLDACAFSVLTPSSKIVSTFSSLVGANWFTNDAATLAGGAVAGGAVGATVGAGVGSTGDGVGRLVGGTKRVVGRGVASGMSKHLGRTVVQSSVSFGGGHGVPPNIGCAEIVRTLSRSAGEHVPVHEDHVDQMECTHGTGHGGGAGMQLRVSPRRSHALPEPIAACATTRRRVCCPLLPHEMLQALHSSKRDWQAAQLSEHALPEVT
jgi:hypothetical protein